MRYTTYRRTLGYETIKERRFISIHGQNRVLEKLDITVEQIEREKPKSSHGRVSILLRPRKNAILAQCHVLLPSV
jgi:hypothetical protein